MNRTRSLTFVWVLRTAAAISLCLWAAGCATQPRAVNEPARSGADPRWNLSEPDAREAINRIQPGRDLTPAIWPNNKRVAVALTFDVDAELVWGNPRTVSPSALSRGRYGVRAGLGRVLALLDRREIPATFFVPALIVKLHPDAIDSIRKTGRHEIGYHGYAHENVRTLTGEQERDAMRRGLEIFKAAGITPRVYRSASWNFSDATLKLLGEFGFRYDSSLMADDRPYELLAGSKPTGIVEFPVDWSLDDWHYFQLETATRMPGLRNPNDVYEIWKAEFDGIRADGGVFVLTMHPQVIGRWSRLRMLERLVDHMDAGGDVWYATLSEIGNRLSR